ncbi:hypothetical protein EV13_1800 [Prochlorococcus sp. MIT 0702]|nr:hypothetical protein EV13_1800 [Prochlorococcus sp. MIT 0702]
MKSLGQCCPLGKHPSCGIWLLAGLDRKVVACAQTVRDA